MAGAAHAHLIQCYVDAHCSDKHGRLAKADFSKLLCAGAFCFLIQHFVCSNARRVLPPAEHAVASWKPYIPAMQQAKRAQTQAELTGVVMSIAGSETTGRPASIPGGGFTFLIMKGAARPVCVALSSSISLSS